MKVKAAWYHESAAQKVQIPVEIIALFASSLTWDDIVHPLQYLEIPRNTQRESWVLGSWPGFHVAGTPSHLQLEDSLILGD